jgi:hypothetical protein
MCSPRLKRHKSIRYSSSCHTRVNMGASIIFTAAVIRDFRSAMSPLSHDLADTDHCSSEKYRCTHVYVCVARTWIWYRRVPCHPCCTHRTSLVVKKSFQFSCGCEQFHSGRSFDFLVMNVCNHGEQVSAVARLVETLCYKPEDRGFESRWCNLNFSLT